jgi:Zn-dependent protease with chaperone function
LTLPFETLASETLPPAGVTAGYFDGRQSLRRQVTLRIEDGCAILAGDGVSERAPLGTVEITDAAGGAPPIVRFAGGAYCEIESREAFQALLARHGLAPGRVTQWEGSLKWVGVAVVVFVLLLAGAYRYGVPLAATLAARQVPAPMVDRISRHVLSTLDGGLFAPSTTPRDRQERLVARFKALRLPSSDRAVSYRIEFRSSRLIGANALALPSGTMIVTDGLLDLTGNDEELLAVLSHEAGHVDGRHGLRLMFQNSIVALGVTWFIGDVNMLVAAAPTALLQAKYSRDFERVADAYAIDVLRANGLSLDRFADILERLDAEARRKSRRLDIDVGGYLSSHPITSERIARLRSAATSSR